MAEAKLDPRTNAYLPDLADARLRGKVEAKQFVEGTLKRVAVPSAPLRGRPVHEAPFDSQLFLGEVVRVFGDTGEGWSWVQIETDGYVGFVPRPTRSARRRRSRRTGSRRSAPLSIPAPT